MERLDANDLVEGDAEFLAGGAPVDQSDNASVDAGDLLQKEVVAGGLSDVVPIGLEHAEVGMDGGDGDVDFLGDFLEWIPVLPELVCSEDSSASTW